MNTVTGIDPGLRRSLGAIETVTCVAFTKAVARELPFHRTLEEGLKLLPVTVSVKPGPPPVTLEGESDAMVGTGLFTVKVWGLRSGPPPG